MDPDKVLEELRSAMARARKSLEQGEYIDADYLDTLVTLFEALDGWMSRGGFSPRTWKQHG